jgi:AcrR family transcriptional regulator
MSSDQLDTRTKILTETWKLMEDQRGQNVHMSDIAKAVGISRQAVYLHFPSRTDLIVATVQYVDEVKGFNARMAQLETIPSALGLLDTAIEVWGNYIPEIYGLAKVMLKARDTDEAMAAGWENCMSCLREACQAIIDALDNEGILAPVWTLPEAVDLLWTLFSINNWEHLTIECSWTQAEYIARLKTVSKRAFVVEAA